MTESKNIQEVFTDIIDDPVTPMRSELNRDELFELADNIKQNGLINPITVRPRGDRFEVVAGHRRLSACKIAGLIKISCVVRDLSDQEVFAVKAAENLERADINPVDEAVFIADYIKNTNKTIPEVAKALRRSISYVESRLQVGEMPDYLQEHLKHGRIKLGSALALMEIKDEETRNVWVEMAARDGVSVAQAEYWAHGWRMGQLSGGTPLEAPPEGFEPGARAITLFECALDKKKYDAELFTNLFIYKPNLATVEALFAEFRKLETSDSLPPVEKELKA